jgi:hypothetical protein
VAEPLTVDAVTVLPSIELFPISDAVVCPKALTAPLAAAFPAVLVTVVVLSAIRVFSIVVVLMEGRLESPCGVPSTFAGGRWFARVRGRVVDVRRKAELVRVTDCGRRWACA